MKRERKYLVISGQLTKSAQWDNLRDSTPDRMNCDFGSIWNNGSDFPNKYLKFGIARSIRKLGFLYKLA